MATVQPLQLCHSFEVELQRLQNCWYDNIEVGRNTYKTAEMLTRSARTDLTSIINTMPVRPGDLSCATADVRVRYRKPDCGDTAKDCSTVTFDCTEVTAVKDEYEACTVTVDNCVAEEFAIRAIDYNCDCHISANQELAIQLATKVRKMYADYNKQLASMVAASSGKLYDGSDFAKLKLFCPDVASSKLELQPYGLYALEREYNRQSPNCSMEDVMFITGSEKFRAYDYAASMGVFNNTLSQGQNASPLGDRFVYDPVMAQALDTSSAGKEGAIAFAKGSLSILEWFVFENDNYKTDSSGRVSWAPAQNGNTLVRQKVDVGTPILGVPFVVDLQMQYNECSVLGGSISYKMKKNFGLFKTPQEAFCTPTGATDNQFNFITMWQVANEAVTDADICTVL